MRFVLLLALIFGGAGVSASAPCRGSAVLSEKACPGDDVSPEEEELFRLVNAYRAERSLPAVPLSAALSVVANRHILDLAGNVGYLTHSWSDCVYDIKAEATWGCLFGAPVRLGVSYAGQGYENLYRNLTGPAAPVLALDAWKKSPHHNSLILSLEPWQATAFDAFGIAIEGNYAAIWFGSSSGTNPAASAKPAKGLGVSFEKAVEGLTNVLSISKESTTGESDRWSGRSADGAVSMELWGRPEDISETAMSVKVKLDKRLRLTTRNRNVLAVLLRNMAPNWAERDAWLDEALRKIQRNRALMQTVRKDKKDIELKVSGMDMLEITVRPVDRLSSIEF